MHQISQVIIAVLILFTPQILKAQFERTSGPGGGYVTHIQLYHDTLYVPTPGGIYYSADEGESWQRKEMQLPDGGYVTHIDFLEKAMFLSFFVSVDSIFLYRSRDNGHSFSRLQSSRLIGGLFQSGDTIYATANDRKNRLDSYKLVYTTDYGDSWQDFAFNPYPSGSAYPAKKQLLYYYYDSLGRKTIAAVHPTKPWKVLFLDTLGYAATGMMTIGIDNNSNIYFVNGNTDIFRIDTFGKIDSIPRINPLGNPYIYQFAFTDSEMYIESGIGVYKTSLNNSIKWKDLTYDLGKFEKPAFSLVPLKSSDCLALFQEWGNIVKLHSKKETWSLSNDWFTANMITSLVNYRNTIYAKGFAYPEAIYATSDQGNYWNGVEWFRKAYQMVSTPSQLLVASDSNLYSLIDPPNINRVIKGIYNLRQIQNVVLASNSDTILVSTDDGDSWIGCKTKKPIFGQATPSYIGGKLLLAADSQIFLSTDLGESWSLANMPMDLIFGSASFYSYGNKVYVALSHYYRGDSIRILESEDNGTSWKILSESAEVHSLVWIDGQLYGIGRYGLYILRDNTGEWTPVTKDIFPKGKFGGISSIALDSEYVFFGTLNASVWRVERKWLTQYVKTQLQKVFTSTNSGLFFTIQPNPVDNKFNLNYSLDRNSKIKVRFLDLLGREVALSLNRESLKGNHTISIDVSHLQKGIYFIEFVIGNSIQTQNLVKK